jgi:hypothetical protein
MSVYVFVGPTLRREEVRAACDAVCLPPVAQGDVYRVARARPRAIGIIDGYFGGAPAVWHKEILWALSRGISVFGSASMGALRAAELHTFGMRGVGRIFEAFRDGILEDDDEVAVVHGPAEIGYVAVSESMVNIRATLARAAHESVVSAGSHPVIEKAAKSLFFPQRNWAAIIEAAATLGVEKAELAALHDWLSSGRIDQKRADALAMLANIQMMLAQPTPSQPDFHFERTHLWEQRLANFPDATLVAESVATEHHGVIEELQLQGPVPYSQARTAAGLQHFASLEAQRQKLETSLEAKCKELARMREKLGITTRAELESWLLRNDLDEASLEKLIEDRARSGGALGWAAENLKQGLVGHLRLSGAYERLIERARHKEHVVASLVAQGGTPESGPGTVQLRLWFFEQRLGMPMPADITGFVGDLGFAELADFDGAIFREWLYLRAG